MSEILENLKKNAPMSLEKIIQKEIDQWLQSPQRRLMVTGEKYYKNKPDILNRKRQVVGEDGELEEVQNLANNRLAHAFIRKLVDQKVGYILSRPISIQTGHNTYQKLLEDFFNKGFHRQIKNIGKNAINKGRDWLHVYYDEQGEFSLKEIPAEEVIPFWKDAAHTILDALIRRYEVETYVAEEKKILTRIEFWDSSGVSHYEISPGSKEMVFIEKTGHFSTVSEENEQPMVWERVPFICFKYNDEEQPLIDILKYLVDDYDKQRSDNSNNLEDLPNSIYVVKNYDGTNLGEFRRNLSVYRAAKVTEDGGIDTLNLNIDTEAHKTHIEQLRRDIYEFGRGVDTQTEKFGNSPTGVALRFLYADLDMDANIIETEFQASLEQLIWFIDKHIYNTTGQDFSNEKVEILFNRDIMINETEAITNAKDSEGILSHETIVANHPWTTDTQEELERLKREKEEDMKQFEQQAYPGLQPEGEPE
ncbi:phage portal protein [Paenibacillus larvae]|uniref:Phage portal protein, SPP1 family n=2 Tax=Paenibacillus larvae TaxID=1464 RepID=A0A2L1U462_9BACL|nr:phage portal protein [Paenibacillus larvae]AQZ46045.1 phage portal protein [Paenibacillus larvae subsp. pulvifaciens]AVF27691.1 phage portal protein, SPP1 family [Paenibacillus larvae subsp. larvae]MBH0344041.1 portal protein [Paenibacillus larvae]MCY7521285.1 phage portal protein [Paenibacillus larvae]MCY9502867.1 phage portal protein [Paenibacillus larvae]